jgi:hypothetical protein
LSLEEELAPAPLQKRQALGNPTCDVGGHQDELDIALSALVAGAPKVAEGYRRFGELTVGNRLEKSMQPVRERQDARFVGLAVARPRAQTVAVPRQLYHYVADDTDRRRRDHEHNCRNEPYEKGDPSGASET